MIYLACPYTHPNKKVEAARAHAASRAAAELVRRGYTVFSPLSHGHAIRCAAAPDAPVGGSWATWSEVSRLILPICNKLVILGLIGWAESRGIRGEAALALELKVPVEVHHPSTLGYAGPLPASDTYTLENVGTFKAGEMDNSLGSQGGR